MWDPSHLTPLALENEVLTTGLPGKKRKERKKERKKESEVTQSWPTLCDPMDCSLPGSSIHGIFQARILEWGAIAFSTRSSQPRD